MGGISWNANGEVEVKNRKTGARDVMSIDAAINRFTGNS